MLKTIEIHGSVRDWFYKNENLIRYEILNQCEKTLKENKNIVDVIIIKTHHGTTKFHLNSLEKIINSLNIALENFIINEEYEYAARTRDCIIEWKKRK
jgi:hypothetical protein